MYGPPNAKGGETEDTLEDTLIVGSFEGLGSLDNEEVYNRLIAAGFNQNKAKAMTAAYVALSEAFPNSPQITIGILSNINSEGWLGLTQGDYQTLDTLDELLAFKAKHYNDGGHALGMCQWDGGRKAGLLDRYIAEAQASGGTLSQEQMARIETSYLVEELRGSESRAYSQIMTASNPHEAAILTAKYFERCNAKYVDQRGSGGVRIAEALQMQL